MDPEKFRSEVEEMIFSKGEIKDMKKKIRKLEVEMFAHEEYIADTLMEIGIAKDFTPDMKMILRNSDYPIESLLILFGPDVEDYLK